MTCFLWQILWLWLWDTDYNIDNWEPIFMKIFVTLKLRVTLESIRNSCDFHNLFTFMTLFIINSFLLQSHLRWMYYRAWDTSHRNRWTAQKGMINDTFSHAKTSRKKFTTFFRDIYSPKLRKWLSEHTTESGLVYRGICTGCCQQVDPITIP